MERERWGAQSWKEMVINGEVRIVGGIEKDGRDVQSEIGGHDQKWRGPVL